MNKPLRIAAADDEPDMRDYYAATTQEAQLGNWDENQNGMLDPHDLILKCSDGNDDDGNGYVDDISGWDFFMDDNDAYDDTRFGHGNGEARDSAAAGNDGRGDIGVCPDCSHKVEEELAAIRDAMKRE